MRAPDIKLTREKQITAAYKLLKLSLEDQPKWRRAVEHALNQMQEEHISADMEASERSKRVTKARASLHQALKRTLVATQNLGATGWRVPIDPAVIQRAISFTKPRRKAKISVEAKDMNAYAKFAAEVANPKGARRAAVARAHDLLKRRGLPIATTGPSRTCPTGGTWYELAAILFGNPKINLFQHMLKYLRDQKKPGHI